jgi:Lipase (class 3)
MGDSSMQIVFATVILFQVVLATPAIQFKASKIKLHAWLQDFAWIERDRESKLLARPFQGEPCFCFETSLKMFYFCNLIYDLDDVPDSPYTLDAALQLYDLTHHRILYHKKQDAKCLAAWNPETRTIVFSFRGTASMANALADIKVWRRPHPPERGRYLFFTQPMVHVGFLQTWEDSGMKDEILALLEDVLNGGDGKSIGHVYGEEGEGDSGGDGHDGVSQISENKEARGDPSPRSHSQENNQAPWRVLVTGHSLGGALAHLCSHDICTTLKDRAHLTCTTFGAPRPGNHSFARSFRETVPDAWDIFHPDDAVARAGKFFVLYKRAAHTVLISPAGELVVRPIYAEQSVRRGISPRLAEHLLGKYAQSLGAILKAAINQDGVDYKRNEARPVLENENNNIDCSNFAGATIVAATPTQEALKTLFACNYVQKLLTSTRSLRQDSLLRITGASPSEIAQARLELLEEVESAAHAAAGLKSGRHLNCGNCLHAGVLFSWLPSLTDLKGRFLRTKSEMELHVQD